MKDNAVQAFLVLLVLIWLMSTATAAVGYVSFLIAWWGGESLDLPVMVAVTATGTLSLLGALVFAQVRNESRRRKIAGLLIVLLFFSPLLAGQVNFLAVMMAAAGQVLIFFWAFRSPPPKTRNRYYFDSSLR